jgi:hypothetical protein
VSGLAEEFPGDVEAHNIDATTPESETVVQNLGWSNHGLVIRSSEGDALWSQPDHEVDIDTVRNKLPELIAARTQ